jgi:hypothetical protein
MLKNNPDAPAGEILSSIISARTGTARENETIKEYVDRIGKTNDIAVTWYLVPNDTQIKDATGRNVGFDPQSGNIYLQSAWHGTGARLKSFPLNTWEQEKEHRYTDGVCTLHKTKKPQKAIRTSCQSVDIYFP